MLHKCVESGKVLLTWAVLKNVGMVSKFEIYPFQVESVSLSFKAPVHATK